MNFGLIAVRYKLNPANSGKLIFSKIYALGLCTGTAPESKNVHSSVGFVDICYHMLSLARAILEIDQRMDAFSLNLHFGVFFLAINISLYYKQSRVLYSLAGAAERQMIID